MSDYLLDTNILSDLIRNPQGRIASMIAEIGEDKVATSIIVAAKLRFGALKKDSAKLTAQVEAILAVLPILPFESPGDECYGHLRSALERSGTPIGANDMLIAAHAIALDRILVTANQREFALVEGLRTANWLS